MVLYTKWFVNHNKFYINIGMFNSILMGYTYGKNIFTDIKLLPGCQNLRTAESSKYTSRFKRIFDSGTMAVLTSSRCICCYPLLPLGFNVLATQ